MSTLYEKLGIDEHDVVEQPCGMKYCTGPALANTRKWLSVDATASKEGEEVARGEAKIPLCPPHLLVWEVFMDSIPDDLLTVMLGYLVDFDAHPISQTLVDAMRD